uniref:Uncharacterized protein n=1 Tax=Pipistrellus kuhlii TaxID=59472 RepID=A0A7J7VVH8_PIPKU|nr:hypothetical protein mPipKuh1_008300 [Pipistrellus kuhlii]
MPKKSSELTVLRSPSHLGRTSVSRPGPLLPAPLLLRALKSRSRRLEVISVALGLGGLQPWKTRPGRAPATGDGGNAMCKPAQLTEPCAHTRVSTSTALLCRNKALPGQLLHQRSPASAMKKWVVPPGLSILSPSL